MSSFALQSGLDSLKTGSNTEVVIDCKPTPQSQQNLFKFGFCDFV